MKKISAVIFISLIIFAAGASSGENFDQKTLYKLQPTDVVNITVHNQPDLTTKTRITADGYISFPLVGKVAARGLTVQELERKIKELLEKDYLVTAEVLVFIDEYHPRQVSIIGEVNNPGKYNMPEEKDMTLIEAIAMAGGFTKDADINSTKIMRTKNGKQTTVKVRVTDITEKGEKDKDAVLEAEDVVIVPESFF